MASPVASPSDEWLEVVNTAATTLVYLRSLETTNARLLALCTTRLSGGAACLKEEHELVAWFWWMLETAKQWDRLVVQHLSSKVPFVAWCKDFVKRFVKTIQVILLQSQCSLLSEVPHIQNIVINSVLLLQKRFEDCHMLIQKLLCSQEELLSQCF
jgi:hypothetical protein